VYSSIEIVDQQLVDFSQRQIWLPLKALAGKMREAKFALGGSPPP
jgi:hypothetical protein